MYLTLIDRFLVLVCLAELAVFVLFGFDKGRARDHGRRVRESTLLIAAVFGGLGAWFAQHLLRHKTRKEPFRTWLGLIGLMHLVLVFGGVWLVLQYG